MITRTIHYVLICHIFPVFYKCKSQKIFIYKIVTFPNCFFHKNEYYFCINSPACLCNRFLGISLLTIFKLFSDFFEIFTSFIYLRSRFSTPWIKLMFSNSPFIRYRLTLSHVAAVFYHTIRIFYHPILPKSAVSNFTNVFRRKSQLIHVSQ